ncbi:MAG TPA: ABC transporter ATP-binding protein [Polyangiaceae bacterium]|nr:ABC transporter ATP-binding protein [Polyangiaceae bacterium]HNZ23017.1 ABC transporter ATP-binding protein [Polyangiaceae bacterium]HOD21206.1 ABC transporter ATP-binding protein [Polyangiaceae bacterium]HOE49030.1 ABC transporter ATP-binding protein [Polyangiaceae bacterium]HOH01843.1 ABC transporter ATP-binding protein [Polyangiaceae bacterium]
MTHQQLPALEARRVCCAYPSSAANAIEDLSVSLDSGEWVAVIGPNGAGKTTLVRVLTGLMGTSRGEVRLFGQRIDRLDRRQIARRIAVVPQHVRVAFGFTVREVVAMGRAPHQGTMLLGSATDRKIVEEVLGKTHLTAMAERRVSGLSGGEQKRVAVARALAQQSDVLVLDEAGAHLDIRHRIELLSLVRHEVDERGLACLSIMHDLNEVAQVADRVVMLREGKVFEQGPVDEVMTVDNLRQIFDVDVMTGVDERRKARYFVPIRLEP